MASSRASSFSKLNIHKGFISELPGESLEKPIDFNDENQVELTRTRRLVKKGCWAYTVPEKSPFPVLVHTSPSMLKELELSSDYAKTSEFLKVVVGNQLLEGTTPFSQAYAGFQFGYFAGQLGDGRAMSLFEVLTSEGKNWELQLKGSGETPFSRMGDGYAVVRSSIREYLASEAMHAIGVPTTRALSLAKTGQIVARESLEDGAIVCRVSPTWVRFGSFELHRMLKQPEELKQLADYTIKHHFPSLLTSTQENENIYEKFFEEVCLKSATMVGHWQATGFVHGVMNTDNMSITGLTLDYGPYGFLETYTPDWTPNSSDTESLYKFANQPVIVRWNLEKLGLALYPLFSNPQDKETADHPAILNGLEVYETAYAQKHDELMSERLGLDFNSTTVQNRLPTILKHLFEFLKTSQVDYHQFLRYLGKVGDFIVDNADLAQEDLKSKIASLIEQRFAKQDTKPKEEFDAFLDLYIPLIKEQYTKSSSKPSQLTNAKNPRFVLRNWIAQEVIDAANKGDFKPLEAAYTLLTSYAYAEDKELTGRYSGPSQDPSCTMTQCSCSS
ncbi:UPF0061-domain-containing protein [Conidiobolus coronatus NRRL 28638]|uniref:Selenoprotein O n=1 Tax=Conidiobolus coronatus (strain ATCC 28846 / CBS 209.66 / NRRL 28638) TaxID=796925 RepID=A0A137P144_CONC2|nr:UPF0061-domain-containing protein [Conidiobolus coronatus NRRL 28638]|eukprot:KXN68763.1 UPF0061-domain-containing protein [Conidiobolus coronatus NRRL 28638]